MRGFMIAIAAAGLAACTTTAGGEGQPGDTGAPDAAGSMTCDAAAAQSHVGQKATQTAGAAILKASGARTLRWGPPGGSWMMDYRQDRVNVRYDEAMTITDITCG